MPRVYLLQMVVSLLRGSRSNETVYFIDGIRTRGTIPNQRWTSCSWSTGYRAKYGDVSGGVISLTSKGPSQALQVVLKWRHQKVWMLSATTRERQLFWPNIEEQQKQTVLGFRFSGQYLPSMLMTIHLPQLALQEHHWVWFNNWSPIHFITLERLNFQQQKDWELQMWGGPLKARPNEKNKNLNITGKIEAKLSSNIDMTISGNYENDIDRFTPTRSEVGNSTSSWAFSTGTTIHLLMIPSTG